MTTENRKPKTENRLFHIITFGCKVNQCDTAGMARELTAQGWSPAGPGAEPDLVIVNTCTVTARADQQALFWFPSSRLGTPLQAKLLLCESLIYLLRHAPQSEAWERGKRETIPLVRDAHPTLTLNFSDSP